MTTRKSGGGLRSEVSEARREELAAEWREVVASLPQVLARHPLSEQIVVETLIQDADAAEREAYRQLSLVARRGDVFSVTLMLDDETAALDLIDVVTLDNARFGLRPLVGEDPLEGSHPFLVIGVSHDIESRRVTLTLWGTAGKRRNRITSSGDYRITSSGAYRTTAG